MSLIAMIPFVLLTAAAAAFGAMFVPGEWYNTLQKPTWTPPNWVFAPVWTALYVLIAVAGWLAWKAEGLGRSVVLWGVGLALNAAWSWLFFGVHRIGPAFVDIVALWLAIIVFIVAVWPVSRAASLLFMPYLAWVSLATALHFWIWWFNP